MRPKGLAELVALYGKPWKSDDDKSRFERYHMGLWSSKHWQDRTGLVWPEKTMPFKRIYCNLDLIPMLDETFKHLLGANRLHEIISFDGCWNVRSKRGNPEEPSVHSFGMAIDFNARLMPFGDGKCLWSEEFLQIMDEVGWIIGAEFPIPDGMHFQYVEGY
jgi:hypothetical protein